MITKTYEPVMTNISGMWCHSELKKCLHFGNKFEIFFLSNAPIFMKEINLKMSSEEWQPSCLHLNMLMYSMYLYALYLHRDKVVTWTSGQEDWHAINILIGYTKSAGNIIEIIDNIFPSLFTTK